MIKDFCDEFEKGTLDIETFDKFVNFGYYDYQLKDIDDTHKFIKDVKQELNKRNRNNKLKNLNANLRK